MEYEYKKIKGMSSTLKSQDGGVWNYLPHKVFLEKGMEKKRVIFGDVTGKSGSEATERICMQQKGGTKTMRMYPYSGRLSFFDKVLGYMAAASPTGKMGFVRIRKKNPLKLALVIGLLLVLLVGGITFAFWNKGPSLDKNAIAYQLPGQVKNTDPDSILLPGYDVLEMNEATQTADAALLNPDGNECYFKYIITLKENGEELYRTGLIKPGTAVVGFKSVKKLEKGSYPIVIKIEAADLKDTEHLYNGGAIEADLEVK